MSLDMNAVVEARFDGKWIGFPLDNSCDVVSSGWMMLSRLSGNPQPEFISEGLPSDASDMTVLIYQMDYGTQVFHASLHNFKLLCHEYEIPSCFGHDGGSPYYGMSIGDLTKDLTHWRVVFWFS